MKIRLLLAAAVAASAITTASHADTRSYSKQIASINSEKAASSEASDRAQQENAFKAFLRAGRKDAEVKVESPSKPVKAAKQAKTTKTTKKVSSKSSKAKKSVAKAKVRKTKVDRTTTASVKPSTSSKGGKPYATIVSRYASQYGVPNSLAHAVITVESSYRASARGAAGEIGLMQIKPATARMMGYTGSAKGLYNPETNIKYGMKYLGKAHQLGGGSTCGTILKYNAGHGAKRMNPISAAYCSKVKRIIGR